MQFFPKRLKAKKMSDPTPIRILQFEAEKTRVRRLRAGGDDGHDGGMPPDLDKRVTALETKVDQARVDLAEIKGRLANMPTTFQLVSWFIGVAIGLTALVFTIARTVK